LALSPAHLSVSYYRDPSPHQHWQKLDLSQKALLPESYLLGAPEAVFHNPFGQGSFGPEILEEYASTYRDHSRVHGICEEYRTAATIDVGHDHADKEASRRIECPMLHLRAECGRSILSTQKRRSAWRQ
jgi:haloacetate dehalogenase